MKMEPVPEPTLRRLPRYYHLLRRLQENGQEIVSATMMAEELGIHHTQVRKDLAATGSVGKPKVGHRVDDLIQSIERFLNWNNSSDAFLVGAGNLGLALLGYQGFEKAGIKIVAAFDANPAKVGQQFQGVTVLPTEKFEDLAKRMHISIGIIAVPEAKAQEIANMMVRSGIQAIWNFAPLTLDLPQSMIVENVELYSSLAIISRKLAERHRSQAKVLPTHSEK
ncbi:redox-sensing transcriptional repressor Rex [Holophaga foetida]|uniref:redox-sensing transcriptional repressor Rex n=1 Tax=Holophaga foetida TaxID=35839 RepID=UPI00024721B8|nr:redox-sensing transcriptional repressor Rex [Holophaga foetida]